MATRTGQCHGIQVYGNGNGNGNGNEMVMAMVMEISTLPRVRRPLLGIPAITPFSAASDLEKCWSI